MKNSGLKCFELNLIIQQIDVDIYNIASNCYLICYNSSFEHYRKSKVDHAEILCSYSFIQIQYRNITLYDRYLCQLAFVFRGFVREIFNIQLITVTCCTTLLLLFFFFFIFANIFNYLLNVSYYVIVCAILPMFKDQLIVEV